MNKSLTVIRTAGLIRGRAFSTQAKEEADALVSKSWDYCEAQDEATARELHESYQLGLRGIRIGQEGLYQ